MILDEQMEQPQHINRLEAMNWTIPGILQAQMNKTY
jgi:hypothetical protein